MEQATDGLAPILRDEYDTEKLPPDQRWLLDPAQAVPADVQFFPEAHRWRSVIINLIIAAICFPIGFAAVGGVTLSFAEAGERNGSSTLGCFSGAALIGFGVGVVCLLNAWNRARAIRAQSRGETARVGLFLSPSGLLQRGPFTYRYFPRERIRGVRLDGTAPMLVFQNDSGEEQALTLPEHLMGRTSEQTVRVVEAWLRGDRG